MSSVVISTSAAQSRPFSFDVQDGAEVCPQPSWKELGEGRPPQRIVSANSLEAFKDARLDDITPASRLAVRTAPEMVSIGYDALRGKSSEEVTGTTFARGRPASGRRRLWSDGARPWRSASADCAPHSVDHMVPFPPRRGTYADCAAGNRAAVYCWELLFVIDQAGSGKIGASKPVCGFSITCAHTRAIADRTGNHGGNCEVPMGAQASSFCGNYICQQDCLGGMKSMPSCLSPASSYRLFRCPGCCAP